MIIFYFLVLLFITNYVHAQSTGPTGNAMIVTPGLSTNPGTYNPGTQTLLDGKTISPQLFYEAHITSCTVNSTCGSTNDSGKALTATAAGVTFTMPNPGGIGSGAQDFGYDGTHSYTVTTVGGGALIYGCGGVTVTSIIATYQITLFTDGVNYQCIQYGGGSGSGSLSKIGNTLTATDSSTLDFIGLTTQYHHLLLDCSEFTTLTGGNSLYLRLGNGGGTPIFATSGYEWRYDQSNTGSTSVVSATSDVDVQFKLTSANIDNNSTFSSVNILIDIWSPAVSIPARIVWRGIYFYGGDHTITSGGGSLDSINTITGIRIYLALSAIHTGQCTLYGYQK